MFDKHYEQYAVEQKHAQTLELLLRKAMLQKNTLMKYPSQVEHSYNQSGTNLETLSHPKRKIAMYRDDKLSVSHAMY